jgi:hypothetical protein
MKTLRLALIAVLVAFVAANVANADGFKIQPKAMKVIKITLEKAVSDPGLMNAMYVQLNPEFLKDDLPFYTKRVIYNSNVYLISGSHAQWVLFFKKSSKTQINAKNKLLEN